MAVYITRLNGMMTISTPQHVQRITAETAYQMGYREMGIYYYNADGEKPEHLHVRLDGIIAGITAGDIVICQFPTWNGLRFERALVEHIRAYRGHVIIFVHDFEALMYENWQNRLRETVELYNQAQLLIVPSYAMKNYLLENGIRKDMKFVVQEIWDYPTDIRFTYSPSFKKEIHFAGSPGKFVFPNHWNYDIPLKVYSDEPCGGGNVVRMGWMNPSALLLEMAKGGFGLVWYGDAYLRQYMGYNNNTKLSAYLAAGIPVIVPRRISNQYLIEGNHLGFAAESLEEATERVNAMTEQEYREYVRCVGEFAPLVRGGCFTKKILSEAVLQVCRRDGGGDTALTQTYRLEECAFSWVVRKESYGGVQALSWSLKGTPDGLLVYDTSGRLLAETENRYQHYLPIEGQGKEEGVVIRAYVNTMKGRLIVAESEPVYLEEETHRDPVVSLVMPAYNAKEYIARSIDTALAQSFPGLEIIIVNDGSTDGTQEVIDWYAGRYPQIRTFYQENAGQASARNTGVGYAAGEYVCFMDNDDMIRPDMVEKLYHSIWKNNCDIAIASVYLLTDKGYEKRIDYSLAEDTAVSVDEFFEHYLVDFYPVIWNKLYRTSLVKERPFALTEYEDDAWTPYVISYAEKVCWLKESLYEYDRAIRSVTDINAAWSKPIEEKFWDHREIVEFFLKNGNPQKRAILKRLALRMAGNWAAAFSYPKYDELKEEIERDKWYEKEQKS